MQGGSARGVPLTAFTLLAFIEAEEGSKFSINRNNAIDYLVRNIPTDPYQLSLVAYALAKADHPGARGALARLDALAMEEGKIRRTVRPRDCCLSHRHHQSDSRRDVMSMSLYSIYVKQNFYFSVVK